MTPQQEKRFRRLWASTRAVNLISEDMGVCRETIGKWRRKLGLRARRRGSVPSFYLRAEDSQPSGREHDLWVSLAQRYLPVITCKDGYRVGPDSVFVTRQQAAEIADGKYLWQVAA